MSREPIRNKSKVWAKHGNHKGVLHMVLRQLREDTKRIIRDRRMYDTVREAFANESR